MGADFSNAMSASDLPADRMADDGLALQDPLVTQAAETVVDPGLAGFSPRRQAVAKAVKAWVDQLVDRSARNNLLFFRDQRAGTLDFTAAEQGPVFAVLAGRSRSVSQLVSAEESSRTDAARRAKAIYAKAQAMFEERGIHTLYLACGLASWNRSQGTAIPAAPVLLAPATLTARGASQQDFDLQVTGDLEVNPTLIHALQIEFGVECDPDELLVTSGIDGAIDTQEELEIVFRWLADKASRVPEFSIRSKTVLGNFSYAKLPMVRDLQSSIDALAEHELVAALAGDPAARQAIRDRRVDVDPALPDATVPADEFLVRDADSSQNHAINKVLAGQDLVIKGPPGTGKSQTITNLISTLLARGRTVLFVAEKRAAIDAVLKRLEQVGLGDLVLDLHGGVSSKRHVAQSLAAALHGNRSITAQDFSSEQQRLEARRRELNGWDQALHHRRAEWGLSLFEAQMRLLALGDDAETDVRLRGAALQGMDPETRERVRETLRRYIALGGLRASSASPWAGAAITTPEQVSRATELIDELLSGAFEEVSRWIDSAAQSVGQSPPEAIEDWNDRLVLWGGISATQSEFDDSVYEEPVRGMVDALAPLGRGVPARIGAALGDSGYRAAKRRARALRREDVTLRGSRLLEALERAARNQEAWSSTGADGPPSAPKGLDELEERHSSVGRQLDELADLLGASGLRGTPVQITERLRALRDDNGTLGALPELHRLRTALNAAGLEALVDELESWRADVDGGLATFDYCVAASISDEIRLSDQRAGAFNGGEHTNCAKEFRSADSRHISSTAQRVRRLVAERAVRVEDDQVDQASVIRREAAKKTRHRPVRETFASAPEVMTAVKPCWVMSPLVVSQILPNDKPYFDVVIFDEASQVRPAEAIPAIARGRRVVVAGDEKQLPPTDFFNVQTVGGTQDDDDVSLSAASGDFESILDTLLFLIEWQMLTWHYRSADERLIAFSNAHLYDRSLLTFPGISGPDCLRHVHVPWEPQHVSDESSNAEVRRVVELILEHAAENPEQSLGVIAMGIKHADRIDGALRLALHERPDLEEYFDESQPERFFIKNLERVQGDERDAIILTVGYGKGDHGQMRYAFGPLNEEGGTRRLNVAITRARHRMTVVSSFTAAEMDPEKTRRGADLLRLYLAYAETRGERLDRQATDTPELNPFEIDIRDALEAAGIPLICQYGVSGYRIDFAAKHPEEPGRLVLAIEADGASYHSAQTARDRDRLRQEQLQRLGWRFHRIWSQDWFRHREREIERALDAYRRAVAADGSISDDEPPGHESVLAANPPASPRGPRPPIPATGRIDDYSDWELNEMAEWIQSDTLLRTRDEHIDAVMSELGFERRGKKIVARIGQAVDHAHHRSS